MLLNLFRKTEIPKNHLIGKKGEKLAEQFLKKEKRYNILSRNWREGVHEIDLICQDKEVLVFVEVKTRAKNALVPGFYAVTNKKREAVRQACKSYLNQLRSRPSFFRFDIIEVRVSEKEKPIINHYINSPLFSKNYK